MSEHLAAWCYATRQTPAVYQSLTRGQRDVFYKVAKEMREKGW